MSTPNNLEQAIKQLEAEMQKETKLLSDKQAELKKSELELSELEKELRDVELKRKRMDEVKKIIPNLKREIPQLVDGQRKKHAEFERVRQSYTDTLKKGGVQTN